jgi:nucleotide-binding universal stress UspA family protein
MTKVFDKILIATDGSNNSKAAVEKGLMIARQCKSAVYVVYVIDMSAFSPASIVTPPGGDIVHLMETDGKKVVEHVKKIATDLNVKTFVISGKPAHEITEFAVKNKVDLIVIGTHGHGGIERMLLGSVADKVIRTANQPVLVVRSWL